VETQLFSSALSLSPSPISDLTKGKKSRRLRRLDVDDCVSVRERRSCPCWLSSLVRRDGYPQSLINCGEECFWR